MRPSKILLIFCLLFSGCKLFTETVTEIEYVDVNIYLYQDGRFATGASAKWADYSTDIVAYSRVSNLVWITKIDSTEVGIVHITAWYYDMLLDEQAGSSAFEIADDFIWVPDSSYTVVWTSDEYYRQSPDFAFYGISVEAEQQ